MATTQFNDVSPYKLEKPHCPETDFQYNRYLQNLNVSSSGRSSAKIGIALFGTGRAGTIHLENLVKNPRVNLLYIVEELEPRWLGLAHYWDLEKTRFLKMDEAKDVFLDPKVQAVVVASPTFTHEEIIRGALQQGKTVFSEKPVSHDAGSTLVCYQQAEEIGIHLFCAFNRRFDPAFLQVYERVRAGEVGHVHMIKTCSRDSPLPSIDYLKISGGIFHDCAVHDIDLICWVLGEYPTQVYASGHAHIEEIKALGDCDTVAITMKFPSGTIGVIDLSRNSSYGYDQRLEVFGARGMLVSENDKPVQVLSYNSKTGGAPVPILYSFPSRYTQGYYNEMEHFLNVVQGVETPAVTGRETMAVSRIATCLENSVKSGTTVDILWKKDELPELGQLKI